MLISLDIPSQIKSLILIFDINFNPITSLNIVNEFWSSYSAKLQNLNVYFLFNTAAILNKVSISIFVFCYRFI